MGHLLFENGPPLVDDPALAGVALWLRHGSGVLLLPFAVRAMGDGATAWKFITSSLAAVYLWGPLVTAWGLIAGWKEGVPTPYLLATCSLIFGGISWAALQIATLNDRNRVRDRLNFSRIRVGRNIHGPGMFLGVDLASQAAGPD
jgi:hypothetical protein